MDGDGYAASPRAPVDWRHLPGLAPERALNDRQRAKHEAALAVLDAYSSSGTPFALFLRTFHIAQLYCHASDGGDGGEEGILLDEHFTRRLRAIGVNVIRVLDSDFEHLVNTPPFNSETPALLLNDSSWLATVKMLIDSAELILSECQFLSPGVVDELRACVAAGKIDQTVLLTPSPPFEFIGNDEVAQRFPRIIHQFDLDLACPIRTFVFQDLVDRMAQIARMEVADRLRLLREGRLREALPVSYRGVPEGLMQLATHYAQQQNSGATYFVGSRAVLAAKAAHGFGASTEYLLSLARLCEQAGNAKLALVLIDEAEDNITQEGDTLSGEEKDQLLAPVRLRRPELLGVLFESLMTRENAAELWQLANSQAGYAVQRQDPRGLAQCLSWMCVAAVQAGDYERAIDHAQDAIALARQSGDAFREAFTFFYLGNAYRGLKRTQEAAKAYAKAIGLFPEGPYGRIHAAALLSLAAMSEKLGLLEPALQLYRSARDMAEGMSQPDLGAVAGQGINRLTAGGQKKKGD
jgi:tetratricopeptide (TPR) repeat protein